MKKVYIILVLILCVVMCSTFVFPQMNAIQSDTPQQDKSPGDTLQTIPEDPVEPPPDTDLSSNIPDDDNTEDTTASDTATNDDNNSYPDNDNDVNNIADDGSDIRFLDIDDIASRGAIVMTLDGRVLFEKNTDRQMRPASIGKMMVVYAVYHYISNNPDKSLTDMITIRESDAQVVNFNNGRHHYGNSIYAKERAQSNARLLAGDRLSVDDLLTLVIMPSAGDACLALANYVSGSNRAFLDYMQTVAREQIGIEMRLNSVHGGTLTVNSNSPNGGRFTPGGAALLAAALLRDYGPEVLEKTELMTFSVTVRGRTIEYRSSNPLMFEADGEAPVEGVTGMKAGRLGTLPDGVTRDPNIPNSDAFANYILTATRDGETIIVVVMEHPWISNWTGENHGLRKDLAALVEYGFYRVNNTVS
jgi:D-alanyl-D-alanine carboxypeptidase